MASYGYADNKYIALAKNLIAMDPKYLSHVDVSNIFFLQKTEKNPKSVVSIKAIPEPYVFITNKWFVIEINEDLASEVSKEHFELYMYRVLRQVGEEPGKIIKPNVVEFNDILLNYSHDWQNKQAIPSIFDILNIVPVQDKLLGLP